MNCLVLTDINQGLRMKKTNNGSWRCKYNEDTLCNHPEAYEKEKFNTYSGIQYMNRVVKCEEKNKDFSCEWYKKRFWPWNRYYDIINFAFLWIFVGMMIYLAYAINTKT